MAAIAVIALSCRKQQTEIRLITLDPDHFHAALVQKNNIPGVSPDVMVYAPERSEGLEQHLRQIDSYNNRKDNPSNWNESVYTGSDFVTKMISERDGNVMITAGNNHLKTNYIEQALSASINVLADKPMAIDAEKFRLLEKCFDIANKNKVLLYDIMTERFEITNILQREFSQFTALYGSHTEGSACRPSIEMESVHVFKKTVSGKPLKRPAGFFDTEKQGEAIADVAVHLVDLVQWTLFPDRIIDYHNDITVDNACRWTTDISKNEFSEITGYDEYPDFLKKYVENDTLKIFTNGSISYRIRNINARVTVRWEVTNDAGCDTHRAIMRGSLSNIIIEQGAEENYIPELYIEPAEDVNVDIFEEILCDVLSELEEKYPGIKYEIASERRFRILIPEEYRDGHEAHFGRVINDFIGFIRNGNFPEWETPCMISKYYVTTSGLEMSRRNNR
jgi:hypothetical protein